MTLLQQVHIICAFQMFPSVYHHNKLIEASAPDGPMIYLPQGRSQRAILVLKGVYALEALRLMRPEGLEVM